MTVKSVGTENLVQMGLGRAWQAHLDGRWCAGQGDKRARCLVLDGRAGGLQQVVYTADEAGTL